MESTTKLELQEEFEDRVGLGKEVNFEEVGSNESNGDLDLDLKEFAPSVCNHNPRAASDAGVMSIINSAKNGRRVTFSKEFMERLGNPTSIQIGLSNQRIALSGYLGDEYTSYPWRKCGAKSNIYSSELVKELTERYSLDFSNRTSITFSEVIYGSKDSSPIAFIRMNE